MVGVARRVCREKKKGVIEKDWGNERKIKEGGKRRGGKRKIKQDGRDGEWRRRGEAQSDGEGRGVWRKGMKKG